MTDILQCPNCKAGLSYPAGSQATTIRCEYCQTTVIVPETLRRGDSGQRAGAAQGEALQDALILLRNGRKVEAIKRIREGFNIGLTEAKTMVEALEQSETFRGGGQAGEFDVATLTAAAAAPAAPTRQRSGAGCIVAVIAVIVIGVGALGPLMLSGGLAAWGLTQADTMVATVEAVVNGPQVEVLGAEAIQATVEAALGEDGGAGLNAEAIQATVEAALNGQVGPALTAAPGPFRELLVIGGQEGTGPGFFNDTRHVGMDGEGNIYAADYAGGRVQVFGPDGAFVDLYLLPDEPYIGSMAVDRGGTLYAVISGVIQRFEARSGAALGPLGPTNADLDVVAVGPDGAVYGLGTERLLRFDRNGAVTLDVTNPLPEERRMSFYYDALAVDGAGNIFVINEEAVLRFSPAGRFVDRFGSEGNGVDQFRSAPYAIAIDGRGRIVVSDGQRLLLFDNDGRYLDGARYEGFTFSMTFTDAGQLLLMDRNGNRVVLYEFMQ